MHKEVWTFNKHEIEMFKESYNAKSAKEALEKWVFRNYDIRHTNGMDYKIGRNKVTIIEYDV